MLKVGLPVLTMCNHTGLRQRAMTRRRAAPAPSGLAYRPTQRFRSPGFPYAAAVRSHGNSHSVGTIENSNGVLLMSYVARVTDTEDGRR